MATLKYRQGRNWHKPLDASERHCCRDRDVLITDINDSVPAGKLSAAEIINCPALDSRFKQMEFKLLMGEFLCVMNITFLEVAAEAVPAYISPTLLLVRRLSTLDESTSWRQHFLLVLFGAYQVERRNLVPACMRDLPQHIQITWPSQSE